MKKGFFIRRVLGYISYRVGIYEVFHHREVAGRSFCLVVLSLRKFIKFQPFHQEKCAEKQGRCQLFMEICLTGWRERLNVQTDVAFPAKRPSVEMLLTVCRTSERKKTTGLTQACNYHQRPLFSTRPYASPPQKPAFTELFRTFAYRAFVWHATVGRRSKSNKNGNGRRMRHLFPTTYPTKYIYLCLKTIA